MRRLVCAVWISHPWRFGVLVSLLLSSCQAKRPASAPDPSLPPGTILRGLELIEYEEDHRLWDLRAEEVTVAPGSTHAYMTKTTARFWSNGKPVSRMSAPSAAVDATTRQFALAGGVVGESLARPARIQASEVKWSPEGSILEARGGVLFTRGRDRLESPELRADQALSRVHLGPGVKARLMVRLP